MHARRLLRPWHPHSPIPVWLLALLVVLAAHNAVQLASTRPGSDQPVDFRSLFLSAAILVDGGDPYDDRLLKDRWLETTRRESLTTVSPPGLPHTPVVYPPWALPLFAPFTALRWFTAARVWYATLPILLVFAVALLAGVSGVRSRIVVAVDLLALALAFRALDWAVLVGQPLFLCLALGSASWWLSTRGRPASAGIALGVAAFKVHLALPFVLLALVRRAPRTLAVAGLTVLLLSGLFLILCDEPSAALASLEDNLAGRRLATYDVDSVGYPLSFKIVTTTSLTAPAELFVSGAWRYGLAIDALLLAAVLLLWFGPFLRGRVSELRAFCLFAVLGLLTTRHYHYDLLSLLPLYLLARETGRSERIALLVVASPLLLPINGGLASLGVAGPFSLLFFNVQLSLLAVAGVLTWGAHAFSGHRGPSLPS